MRRESIFSQGDNCSDIQYIERGVVKLTLVSKRGRSAVLGILGTGDFIGEACVTGLTTYSTSAVAIVASTLLTIGNKSMAELLEQDTILAKRFIHYLLVRQQRIERDLIDHLLNPIEKRLARTLWLLSE